MIRWQHLLVDLWTAESLGFIILFGVTACTPTVLQPVASNCVPITSYSQDWQAAFAGEVDALTATHQYPHVEQFIVDSERTRSALKVCR